MSKDLPHDPPDVSTAADPAGILDRVVVILLRPQSSDNVGATARAMKNFGLKHLRLVAPRGYDRVRAGVLAVHAEELLDAARIFPTLDEAVADLALVIPTTERAIEGREPPVGPRESASLLLKQASTGARVGLLFGAEDTGLSTATLAGFSLYASIPSHPGRRSLNLAQAVLLFAWELYQATGDAALPQRPDHRLPDEDPAPLGLRTILRERARTLLLHAGFLNPQAPDVVLDELFRWLWRGAPSRREAQLLIAAVKQVERVTNAAKP